MKVLVAEDDAMSRTLLSRTLQRVGYEIIAVEDGVEALAELMKEDATRLALSRLDDAAEGWGRGLPSSPAACRNRSLIVRAHGVLKALGNLAEHPSIHPRTP